MDTTLRQTLAGACLATGCLVSASSHAYNAADDADAQNREVKAAYDRGYQAARQELAREAASKGAAAATPPPTATAAPASPPAQKTAAATARKPILDIKHVYSDASEIETVQEVPVTARPLPEQQSAQAPAPEAARVAQPQPQPAARRPVAVASDDSTDTDAPQNYQPVQRPKAQARNAAYGRTAQRVPQQDAMSADELADDDAYDAPAPRAAQVYSTGQQYARPRAQYAPPPAPMPPPSQAYGYAQRPTYVATRPYGYYAPSGAWVDAYQQPAPYAGRWYWSPEYGRWLYY